MQVRDLRWLVVLSDEGGVTAAAEVLGVPQPTVTRALARCEAELGARLFDRVPAGLRVTPAGEVAVAAARDLTVRWEQMRAAVAGAVDPDAGLVRLAFVDSMATSLVPAVLRAFHAQAPRVRLQLRQEAAHEVVADLDAGLVDVAITSARPPGPYGWRVLQQERLVLVVPPRHRWADRRSVAVAELDGQEMVTTPRGFGHRQLVDDLLRGSGAAAVVSFESQDLATIEGLVSAGLGLAVVPEAIAGATGTVSLPLDGSSAGRTIGLAWRDDRALTSPVQRFCDVAGSAAEPGRGSAVTGPAATSR